MIHAKSGARERCLKFGQKAGKIDLFISELAPILGERFCFQAQYRFNRPAAWGGCTP
jgi:hypothetical protein